LAGFDFRAPDSIDGALEELAADGSVALAGGTSLVLMLKQDLVPASRVVWLGRISGLRGISSSPEGALAIGATTTVAEIAASSDVQRLQPALAEAAAHVGNPRVRAVATLGGGLVHADPRQDLPPVLLALGASATVRGRHGEREVSLERFFNGLMETDVADGEILTRVTVPAAPPGRRSCYMRFTPASEDDFPTVGVAAALDLDPDGSVRAAAVGLGGVAGRPVLVEEAAGILAGRRPGAAEVAELAAAAERACDPVDDQRGSPAYKRAMARVWTRRALERLLSAGR
jgi:carbon-monoxide dehydrogenase medium subunit